MLVKSQSKLKQNALKQAFQLYLLSYQFDTDESAFFQAHQKKTNVNSKKKRMFLPNIWKWKEKKTCVHLNYQIVNHFKPSLNQRANTSIRTPNKTKKGILLTKDLPNIIHVK